MPGTIIGGWGGAPTDRDLALRREMALLAELEAQAKLADLNRRKADPLEKAKMDASARQFETRRGVREVVDVPAFTPENFPMIPAHEPNVGAVKPPPMRTIKRAAPEGPSARVSTQFGEVDEPPMRTIRRFTDQGTAPVDPDAAMGARERAMLAPSVLAEQERSRGDLAAAQVEADAKGKSGGPSSYAIDSALRAVEAVNEVLPNVNWLTAGGVGSLSKFVPGTPAADVRADLERVAGNVAFNALQAMREASKTGGALGQVAVKELELLTAVEGSIRQDQSPPNLRKNLKLVRDSQQRFLDEARKNGAQIPDRAEIGKSRRTVGRFIVEDN